MKIEDIKKYQTLAEAESAVIDSLAELNAKAKRAGEIPAINAWSILHTLINEDLDALEFIREGRREEYRRVHRQLTPRFSSPPAGVQ